MATLKVLCAVGVMISCSVIVYPRFVHPIVLQILGMSDLSKIDADDSAYPPHYRTQHPEKYKPQASPEDPRKNVRAAPHPGMRAAADMQKQAPQGSGRGMMGVVLPMYAIGIVVYLVYTLFKVFNKSKNSSWNQEPGQIDGRRQADNSVDRMGFPVTLDSSADVRNFLHDQQQKQQLEDLLARMDNKNVSVNEMKLLQQRLEETEAQMSRILQAMQMVQTNVDHMGVPEHQGQPQTQQNDLSPDMDSYELINRRGEVLEARDTEEKDKKKINPEEGKADTQNQEVAESNTELVKLSNQAGRLHKEVDFDDIDKDSDDDIESVSEDKEAEVGSPSEDVEKSNEDGDGQTECPDLGLRQRKRQS